jgi:predicted transcriptional regulator of viral defense system
VEDRVDRLMTGVAEQHHGIFGAHHLREHGVSDHERKYRLGSGRWSLVHERVYRIAGAPLTWHGAVLAACWAGGVRAVASHHTAAELWHLPGGQREIVEITCPRWRRAQHGGLLVHESSALAEVDCTEVDGIPTTTVARTIFDLTASSRTTTVDLAIDAALRKELTTLGELEATLDRLSRRGRAGVSRFRRILAERSDHELLPESPPERRLVRLLRAHGLPVPVLQYEIRGHDGRVVARADLAYPDLKIAIEYDSYEHHVGKAALVRDGARRNAIVALDWLPITATAADLRNGGHRLASELRRARALRSGVKRGG